MITEILRCRDCGTEYEDYHQLKHYSEDSGGFCRACGSDAIIDVQLTFAQGDGSMAKLMANGQCPKCHCDMNGEMKCENCGLEIVNG